MAGGGFSMDSISRGVKKTILDIKEISRVHTEEEIYTMLQECSMDPNETVQKLLAQDTFHEVKRKRDKKKENMNNRELTDRLKQGMQKREVRSGSGTYSSRYASNDAGVARNLNIGKENGISQVTEKGTKLVSSLGTHEMENGSGTQSSTLSEVVNGPTNKPAVIGASHEAGSNMPDGVGFPSGNERSDIEKGSESAILLSVESKGVAEIVVGAANGQPAHGPRQVLSPEIKISDSISAVCASSFDPAIMPSCESCLPGVVATAKHEVGSERTASEPDNAMIICNMAVGAEISSHETAEKGSSSIQGMMLASSQVVEMHDLSGASRPSSSSQFGSVDCKTSSNCSSGDQRIIGPQKTAALKEWKPKPASQDPVQVCGTIGTSDSASNSVEMDTLSVSGILKETMPELQKKMEELRFSDDQHVFIPNHLQVPESERTGLSFGSFDANFTVGTRVMNDICHENSGTKVMNGPHVAEDNIQEFTLSSQNSSTVQVENFPDNQQSLSQVPENLPSVEADISSVPAVLEHEHNKQEATVAQGGDLHSAVHATRTYSTFGVSPPVLGSQLSPFCSSEPQTRDVQSLPSFVVQQPFDLSTAYYAQICSPREDENGRCSAFISAGATAKYNGNVANLSSQTGQATLESTDSVIQPTTATTPLLTQPVAVMPTSIAVTHQPIPVFRQPSGMHMSHFSPNYFPYQYLSPFYISTPTIQHFLNNAAYLQQPLGSSMYPPAPPTNPVKNTLSQYKAESNNDMSLHSGMPTGYGPYSSAPAGFSQIPPVTNSSGNEDIRVSWYKDSDAYITGQQSEGSTVWLPSPTPAQEMTSVQTSSLYNLPRGQHVTFTPFHAGHGAFNGIYHPIQPSTAAPGHSLIQPSQTVTGAVDMVGRPSGAYQQPQRAQVTWASNY